MASAAAAAVRSHYSELFPKLMAYKAEYGVHMDVGSTTVFTSLQDTPTPVRESARTPVTASPQPLALPSSLRPCAWQPRQRSERGFQTSRTA